MPSLPMPYQGSDSLKGDAMSEMWEQGLHPAQAEVHEPIVDEEIYWEHEMAESPEEDTVHTITTEIPWGLKEDELVFVDVPADYEDNWFEALHWLKDTNENLGDEEFEVVFLSAALLRRKNPGATWDACIHQAIVWSRG